jgi:integrase
LRSAILGHLQGRWRPLLLTAIFTGLRASELRGLRWADVDLKKAQLRIRQVVVGAAGLSASNSIAGDLARPTVSAIGQYRTFETRGTARPSQAQLEQARRNLALAMIGSFVALLVGAGASVAGSQWLPENVSRTATFAEQQRR